MQLEIKTIAVIGATERGRTLAEAALRAGYVVVLEDIVESRRHAAADSLRTLDPNAAANLILATTIEDALRQADLVIEAVPEELEMKLELFTIFDKFARPKAILASTTESLSIQDLAAMTACPERCIGFVLRGARQMILTCTAKTASDTLKASAELARRIGREVIVTSQPASAPQPPTFFGCVTNNGLRSPNLHRRCLRRGITCSAGLSPFTVILLSAVLALGNALHRPKLAGPAGPVPNTSFGMHIHEAVGATPWPPVQFGAWRLWDAGVSWAELEPQRGQWRWDKLDRYVAMAEVHHVEILLTLGLTPTWASSRPGEKSAYWPGNAAPSRDLEDWRKYVGELARRYKGRIAAYEIWNEPDLKQTWTGSVQQMIDLARESSQVIRQIDPEARVVSPAAAGVDVNWLAEFLARGGGQYVDVIGYHFYVTPKPPEAMLDLIRRVKQVIREHGFAEKPLWNTETGWSRPKPFPSDDLAAAYVARSYVMSWAAGVERFYWYAWDNHRWVSLEMTQPDSRELRPAARAYAEVQRWLLGAVVQDCEDRGGTWVCTLQRDGKTQRIVWTERATSTFAVPQSWEAARVSYLLGDDEKVENGKVELGIMPILLESR